MTISKAQKAAYNDEIKTLKSEIENYDRLIKDVMLKKKKNKKLEPYYNIEIVNYLLGSIEQNIKINELSVNMLGIKNNKSLDMAKSNFSRILQLMKENFGDEVDRESLKENEEYLAKISRLNARQILDLTNRINDTFHRLKNSMGGDSKWKWLFVELQAKVAIMIRNLINFSDIQKYRDPRTEFFYDRREHLTLAKDSLEEAAKQYRTKYELSAKAREDLKRSIELLEALRKIHMILGESNEADKLKTTIDAARFTLEAGDKKQDSTEKDKKKTSQKNNPADTIF
jgi:hypothetical protein